MPSLPRGPGSSARKNAASSRPNARSPLGTDRRPSSGRPGPRRCAPASQRRRSSARSAAVRYRSLIGRDRQRRQIRSSSRGMPSDTLARRPGLAVEDLLEVLGRGPAPERQAAGQAAIEDDPEGPDVGPAVEAVGLAPDLLGGHVGQGAGDLAPPQPLDLLVDGQAEVADLRARPASRARCSTASGRDGPARRCGHGARPRRPSP